MTIGPMRQRVTLQTNTPTKDALNQDVPHWTVVGTYWAEVVTLSGRELENARQLKATVTHRVRTRYVGPISAAQRFLWNGRVLNIEFINNVININREYQILCTETAVPAGT